MAGQVYTYGRIQDLEKGREGGGAQARWTSDQHRQREATLGHLGILP